MLGNNPIKSSAPEPCVEEYGREAKHLNLDITEENFLRLAHHPTGGM